MVFDETDEIPYDYVERLREIGHMPHRLPIATMGVRNSARIDAQKGCFTVHGRETKPLDVQSRALGDPVVRKIPLPIELTSELQEYLRDAGVGEYALFPDLDGLGRDLCLRFAFKSRKPEWVRPLRKSKASKGPKKG